MKKLIKDEKPDSLILLGDIKSSIQSITKSEWNDIPYFFEEIDDSLDVILIPGNHDANIQRLIPDNVIVSSSKGLIIDNVLLTHGHAMPSENFSNVKIQEGDLGDEKTRDRPTARARAGAPAADRAREARECAHRMQLLHLFFS